MKKSAVLLFAAMFIPMAVIAQQEKSYVPEGYTMVWQDEFDEGPELDATKWSHVVMRSGMVNHELQNYVNHVTPGGAYVTEVKDGTLRINCFKENDKIYSGRINGNARTGWLYGYFEARLKLPVGKGTWPAFWMMPAANRMPNNGWPRCGEIDIMEEVGFTPNEVSSSIHTQDYNHTKNTHKNHAMTIADAEGAFHVYSLLWTEDEIITYVDGMEQLHLKKSELGEEHDQWPFHYAFHVILNLAWGGDWGGQEGVDESVLPIKYEIDYVRVYQKN